MVYKTHVHTKIDSRLANEYVPQDGTGVQNSARFETFLQRAFTLKEAESRRYYMRLEDVDIPLTYYNVNSNFNVFKVTETDGVTPVTLTITLEEANYTASEIAAELGSALTAASSSTGYTTTYTIQYDEPRNRFEIRATFTAATGSFVETITNGSTLNEIAGVGKADTANITGFDNTLTLVNGTFVEAPFSVKLDIIQYLQIVIKNLSSNNGYLGGKIIHLGAFVPTSLASRGERIYYENAKTTNVQLNSKDTIHHLEVELLDNYGNFVDLNGRDYNFNLVLEELVDTKTADSVHNLN